MYVSKTENKNYFKQALIVTEANPTKTHKYISAVNSISKASMFSSQVP